MTNSQQTIPNIAPRPNDDGTWYVNIYFPDADGRTLRETLADGLTEIEAADLSAMLERMADKLTFWEMMR